MADCSPKSDTAKQIHSFLTQAVEPGKQVPDLSRITTALRAPRSYFQRAARVSTPASSGGQLGNLPPELRETIVAALAPSSVVTLGMTCRKLFLELDCTLTDIELVEEELAGAALEPARRLLAEERFTVTELLDRDYIEATKVQEIAGELDDGWLLCSVCADVHPAACFSASQSNASPEVRVCLAAQAGFQVCCHQSLDLAALRTLRNNARTKGGDSSGFVSYEDCRKCFTRHRQVNKFQRSLFHSEFESCFQVFNLLLTSSPEQLLHSTLARAQEHLSLSICEHLTLSGPEILASLENSNAADIFVRFGPGRCSCCKTTWYFVLEADGCVEKSYTLKLEVNKELGDFQMAWKEQYVRMLKDGEELMGMCGAASYKRKREAYLRRE